MSVKTPSNNRIWNRLTGDPSEFSMENRAFNFISIVSAGLLVACFTADVYIHQFVMCGVVIVLLVMLAGFYYLSRYKKKYQLGIAAYAFFSYLALIINYYNNSGINGPTICLFFVTFNFYIAIARPKRHGVWIVLHILIVGGLLISEYYHPEWVPNTYAGRADRFFDAVWTYTLAIALIFAVTNYLRNYYNHERILAEERALAIAEQNKQILAQNELLEKVNMEKNKLFSIVSHDLKMPLDAIRGYLELLTEQQLDETDKAHIELELLEQTKYTSDLLLNLLYWAKAQMQGITVNITDLRLEDMIEDLVSNKVNIAAKKGIQLTYTAHPEAVVQADKDMLRIVLRNIVNNAIKFTETGGAIYIETTNKDYTTVISIKDTGIGIPQEKHGDVFTLKTRSTYGTNNEKGIGLGLMMCKEFVGLQGGDIWFESTPGKGTVFYISLSTAHSPFTIQNEDMHKQKTTA